MCRRAAATNEADPRLEPTLFSMPQVAPPSNSPRWRHLLVSQKAVIFQLPEKPSPSNSPKHRPLLDSPKCRYLVDPRKAVTLYEDSTALPARHSAEARFSS